LGTIIAPKHPHNLTWGGDDGKTLYMTARDSIYRMPLNIPAAPRTECPSLPRNVNRWKWPNEGEHER
jgi:hypothetical protein